ncbi:MAG: hypothetical protein J7647_10570 [Cyanobacteria bacterium SBLK]|nr:hypothetical protein [Cyanobacteria bacterium SBLK]
MPEDRLTHPCDRSSNTHSKIKIFSRKRSPSQAIATPETSDETDFLIERIALERDYYHTCTYGEY